MGIHFGPSRSILCHCTCSFLHMSVMGATTSEACLEAVAEEPHLVAPSVPACRTTWRRSVCCASSLIATSAFWIAPSVYSVTSNIQVPVKHDAMNTRAQNSSSPIMARVHDAELVVAYYGEGTGWFADWEIPIHVYNKKRDCDITVQEEVLKARSSTAPNVSFANLQNIGREGQTYLHHIVQHYHSLPTYTVFAQGAGQHNGVHVRDIAKKFLSKNEADVLLYPIVPHNTKGPIFNRDAEEYEASGMELEVNTDVFYYIPNLRMADRARLLYLALFGGNPCDVPAMVFPAGAQFIIHKAAIHAKPLSFWEQLEKVTAECFDLVWDLERVWLHVFDPVSKPVRNIKAPKTCQRGAVRDWIGTVRCINRQSSAWQPTKLLGVPSS